MINPVFGFYLRKYFDEKAIGQACCKRIEALQEVKMKQPDCVLLDMKMNGIDGIEVLKRIRKDWPEIPVIMMTAYGEMKLIEEALELGAAKYFTKPFDIYEVRDAVNEIFEN